MKKFLISLFLIFCLITNAGASVKEYSFYCVTESASVSKLADDSGALTCPNNVEHVIDTTSVSILREINPTYGLDAKGRIKTINTSRSDDRTWTYFTSYGDDPVNGIGAGDAFIVKMTNEAEITHELEFIEDVEVNYGIATFKGAEPGDKISVYCKAEATPLATWETGLKLMKYEIIPNSGYNMIMPAPEGYPGPVYQFDESNHTPIPVEAYDNAWNLIGQWDRPTNPETYYRTAYAYNPGNTGKFAFYDFPVTLGYFCKNISLVGDGQVILGNEDSFRMYKGWELYLQVENGNPARSTPLILSVILKLNRKTIR